ncbi:MAG: hypothetical protein IJ350_02590 [Clostridia bacterium]|nr:hypothetical protein [Clostridia bacterium]MBQ7865232.1 hypothetical protein [Clostridia bacterium]
MIDTIKRILAILALISAAVFVVAVIILTITGQLAAQPGWIYGSMSVFLMLGLLSLLINWLQKKAAEHKQEQNP